MSSSDRAAGVIGRASRNPWAYSQPSSEKSLPLRGSFDALGDAVEVEQTCQADDRGRELAIGVVGVDAVDEPLVDLQDVDRQPSDVAQRGLACAEVVDGYAHAERPQRSQSLDRELDVVDHDALGDLEQ